MNMELIFLFFADYPILGNEKSLPLYLQNMGHHHCQDHLIRPEGYHYDQILYCHMIPPYSYPLKRPTNTIQKRIYGISTG